jgi:hypothetical protein
VPRAAGRQQYGIAIFSNWSTPRAIYARLIGEQESVIGRAPDSTDREKRRQLQKMENAL